jgi:hypothetical protein
MLIQEFKITKNKVYIRKSENTKQYKSDVESLILAHGLQMVYSRPQRTGCSTYIDPVLKRNKNASNEKKVCLKNSEILLYYWTDKNRN